MSEYDLYGSECRVIAVPGALAAAGVTYPFPGVVSYKVLSLAFTLVTAAGGGNRQVIAKLNDATGHPVYAVAAPGTQAGALTVVYSFAPSLTANGSSALGFQQAPFVDGRIAENLTLALTVGTTQAADAISNVRVLVQQWERVHPDRSALRHWEHAAA